MTTKGKIRLDHLLVERGLAESGARAQALILAGTIRAPGVTRPLKPGLAVDPGQPLEVLETLKYVSRGGVKLEGALDRFALDVRRRVCLDVGASTGGFTDCLLQRGAAKVFAVDVGRGQLHWKLRQDPRVVNREGTHVLKMTRADLPESPDFVVVDVSFISLEKVLPRLSLLVKKGTMCLAMVKPQFEAGPKNVVKGVVKDPAVREAAIAKIRARLPEWGFALKDEAPSTLKGPKGNLEHFLYIEKT